VKKDHGHIIEAEISLATHMVQQWRIHQSKAIDYTWNGSTFIECLQRDRCVTVIL
jgi:hypothetical protein